MNRFVWHVLPLLLLGFAAPLQGQQLDSARTSRFSLAASGASAVPLQTFATDTTEDDGYVNAIGVGAIVGAVVAGGITWFAVRRSPCTDYCIVSDGAAPFLAAIPGFLLGAGVGWLIEKGRRAEATR